MRRKRGLLALILLAGLLAGTGILLYVGHALAAPMPAVIGPPPPDLRPRRSRSRALPGAGCGGGSAGFRARAVW